MTHIVIPYKDEGEFDLIYSLRGLFKYFKSPFDVTIIGDRPKWLFETHRVKFIEMPQNPLLPRETNIARSLEVAANLYDEFLLFHDDMILRDYVTANDFDTYHTHEVDITDDVIEEFRNSDSVFLRAMVHTALVLKGLGIPHQKNFITHTPKVFKSSEFFMVMDKVDLFPEKHPAIIYENAYGALTEQKKDLNTGFWTLLGPYEQKIGKGVTIIPEFKHLHIDILKEIEQDLSKPCIAEV